MYKDIIKALKYYNNILINREDYNLFKIGYIDNFSFKLITLDPLLSD